MLFLRCATTSKLTEIPSLAVRIPVVSLNDDGRIVLVSEENGGGNLEKEPVNKEKRKLKLDTIPFSLTCILHNNYILADPTAEEESIMDTIVTVVLDSSSQLVSLYKPGGPILAHTSAIQVRLHLHCFVVMSTRNLQCFCSLEECLSLLLMIMPMPPSYIN